MDEKSDGVGPPGSDRGEYILVLSEMIDCRLGNEEGDIEVMGFILVWFLRVCWTSSAIESMDEREMESSSCVWVEEIKWFSSRPPKR